LPLSQILFTVGESRFAPLLAIILLYFIIRPIVTNSKADGIFYEAIDEVTDEIGA